jgi:hypothetical protein
VSKDQGEPVDASVDLAFSLTAFELYRKSGILSAAVRSIAGLRGQGQAYIELVQGKVVACYILDRNGERHQVLKDFLVQLDSEKGPLNWVFRESTAQAFSPPPAAEAPAPPPVVSRSPTPRPLVYTLDAQQLQPWTPQQRYYLQQVFTLIDGQRSVDELRYAIPLPAATVDEALRVLVALKAITLDL